jgi:hypothetical protein
MRQTAGLRSRASSTPTRSPPSCGRSWASAARGRAVLPTYCGLAAAAAVTALRGTGPKTPARSPAACVGGKRFCGHWALRLRSVGKAERETGSSGCVLLAIIPSAPSAASVTMTPGSGQPRLPPAGDFCGRDRPVTSATTTLTPIWSARHRSGRSPSHPTVLTVLTKTPPFGPASALVRLICWRRCAFSAQKFGTTTQAQAKVSAIPKLKLHRNKHPFIRAVRGR